MKEEEKAEEMEGKEKEEVEEGNVGEGVDKDSVTSMRPDVLLWNSTKEQQFIQDCHSINGTPSPYTTQRPLHR